ncbi:MAG: DUF2505 family protein [Acidimicrobiales bacterium]
MRFTLEQRFTSPPDAVARAFADPDLYVAFHGLPKMTAPEVLGHQIDGKKVVLRIRYRFDGELSSAARAVLDPDRLTWVEHSTHDLTARTTTFTMLPDHYADRFRCTGTYRFQADGAGTVRRCQGEIRVKALLVGGAVERAIVSGLEEHLAEEVPVVETFLSS